jgi:hypothetical protein
VLAEESGRRSKEAGLPAEENRMKDLMPAMQFDRDAAQMLADWLDAHPAINAAVPLMGEELLERRSAEMLKLTYEERTRQPLQKRKSGRRSH